MSIVIYFKYTSFIVFVSIATKLHYKSVAIATKKRSLSTSLSCYIFVLANRSTTLTPRMSDTFFALSKLVTPPFAMLLIVP